jgi:hypothetical protein
MWKGKNPLCFNISLGSLKDLHGKIFEEIRFNMPLDDALSLLTIYKNVGLIPS